MRQGSKLEVRRSTSAYQLSQRVKVPVPVRKGMGVIGVNQGRILRTSGAFKDVEAKNLQLVA